MIDVVGQTLWVGGHNEELGRLRAAVAAQRVGGVVFFRRNAADVEGTLAWFENVFAGCDDYICAIDQEGGRVRRLDAPLVELPSMRALAELRSEKIERVAALVGEQLRLLGFTMNFAPVVDVDTNPKNPIIGDRAFGDSVEQVVGGARAFARGLRAAGIHSCAKHFPGHGDTDVDSHLALPILTHDEKRLHRVELAPFRELCDDVDAVMTAHISVPALDAKIATVSAKILAILRNQFNFQGVIISDDLEMRGISSGDPMQIAERAIEALVAGCDVVLICSNADAWECAYDELRREYERSSAFARRLAEAGSRTQTLRRPWRAQSRDVQDKIAMLTSEARSLLISAND